MKNRIFLERTCTSVLASAHGPPSAAPKVKAARGINFKQGIDGNTLNIKDPVSL